LGRGSHNLFDWCNKASLTGPQDATSGKIDVEDTRIDGDEDGGGNDGMVITLMGGVIRGADLIGVGLCHCKGDN